MTEFIQTYGLWILLGGIFVAMHWFGMGCCGGSHRHGQRPKGDGKTGDQAPAASAQEKSGSCH